MLEGDVMNQSMYLNGELVLENEPFRFPMATLPIIEFYIQQISATNALAPNVVALDNFSYTLFIPEPSSTLLVLLGLGGFILQRRSPSR